MDLFYFIDSLKSRQHLAHMSMKVAPHEVENVNDDRVAHRVENLMPTLQLTRMFSPAVRRWSYYEKNAPEWVRVLRTRHLFDLRADLG